MSFKKFVCTRCYAPKLTPYHSPYVVCDFCSILFDVDYAAGYNVWTGKPKILSCYENNKTKIEAQLNTFFWSIYFYITKTLFMLNTIRSIPKLLNSFLYTFFLFLSYSTSAQTTSKPLSIGVSEQLQSAILGEVRTINIYLPENYAANDTLRYPVIYIPDGGIEEDFIHIAGIVRYNTQPWVNRFPKSIVVGIENTNRKRDFTFAVSDLDFLKKAGYKKEEIPHYGASEKYIAFLQNELQPCIQNKYKTNGHNTIIGESLAGLLISEILLKHPALFDVYIIISPSLWWGDELLLKQAPDLLKQNVKKQIKVYIGAPNKNEQKQMYDVAKKLFQRLQSNKNITATFDYLPKELHSTVIHQAVYNAFKKIYPNSAYSK